MPSAMPATEPSYYLDPQDLDTEALATLSPMDLGLDEDTELVGEDSDMVTRLRASLWNRFMEQSKKVMNNTDEDAKVLQCFHEYVIAFMEPEYGKGSCPVKFDGVSCWPETPPGTVRSIPCFTDFNGVHYDASDNNATLYCFPNGTWSKFSVYNACLTLITHEEPPEREATISTGTTIFYVGNSLSLIAVTLALWIFISFKDLRCLRNKIHTNLLFTYLLHTMFWIIYASLQSIMSDAVGCFFYVALNYLFLTNFMWMFVEGLYLYVLVVKTFSVENIKLRIYTIIGWGIPIPIIILWVVIKSQLTSDHRGTELEDSGMEGPELEGIMKYCPLMPVTIVDWIHRVPVLILLSGNLIFLTRIMWVLITKLRSANTVETQRYRKATKALLVLIPLLGLTYVLLIALPKELEHFQAILLSTQGFWVAVLYCFLNSEVQNSIRHHIERWRTERGINEQRRTSLRNPRDESPRPKSGYRSYGKRIFGGKRESLCSEVSTMTTFVTNGYNLVSTHAPSAPPAAAAAAAAAAGHPGAPPSGQNTTSVPLIRNQCSCINPPPAGMNNTSGGDDDVKIIIRDSVI